MALVKLLDELVKDKINDLSKSSLKLFRNSIHAIYGSTDKGQPEHIGTCTLITVNSKNYMITAAHVIDNNEYTCLYIGGSRETVLIEGNAFVTTKPDGNRKNDHYDFAWMEVTDEVLNELGGVSFIQEKQFMVRDIKKEGRLFVALGYPNTKNRKIDNKKHSITKRIWRYSSTIKEDKDLCKKLNITGKHHYFLDYNSKYSKDSDGKKMNSLSPVGMSGGALIDMCSIIEIDHYNQNAKNNGYLAGILIENQKEFSSMVSVRITIIRDSIIKTENQKCTYC